MVSGQEDDGDVERLPHSEGKRMDMFLGDAFFCHCPSLPTVCP